VVDELPQPALVVPVVPLALVALVTDAPVAVVCCEELVPVVVVVVVVEELTVEALETPDVGAELSAVDDAVPVVADRLPVLTSVAEDDLEDDRLALISEELDDSPVAWLDDAEDALVG
jgi:hypothetical protein